MKYRFITVFNDFAEVHLTKDVGMIPIAAAEWEGARKSLVYYRQESAATAIANPYSEKVELIGIAARSQAVFLLKLAVSLLGERGSIINLYHLRYQSLLLTLWAKIIGKKVYVKLDMDDSLVATLESNWNKQWRPKSLLTKAVLCLADCVSVENRPDFERLKHFWAFRNNLVHMPNGVLRSTICAEPTESFAERNKVILIVGRIGAYQKNHELILDTLPRLPALKGWRFLFAGPVSDEFRVRLAKLMTDVPALADSVELLGNQDRKSLFHLYATSAVFLLPSRYEGFSLALVEAAFMGCYVIATDVGGVRAVTDNGRYGTIIDQENVRSLQAALERIMDGQADAETTYRERLRFAQENFDQCVTMQAMAEKLGMSLPQSIGDRCL
jgi:glycosyltransferase involved in cell wall biosynthesis